jgi:SAM-dependent methyltransferase
MRQELSDYWDKVANKRFEGNYMSDNIWKRAAIVSRIFSIDWDKKRVLEIGAGYGTIAYCLGVVYLRRLQYIGTEVSPVFCEKANELFNLNIVNTDIMDLPTIDNGFNRVIALDSLEHIRPEEREKGFSNIGRVMADDATMVINMPLNPSSHDKEFDFGFGLSDIDLLCRVAYLKLFTYEDYKVVIHNEKARRDVVLNYGWVVLRRGNG